MKPAHMKQEPDRYLAKIVNNAEGRRTLAGLRKVINRGAGKLTVRFSGPRGRGGQSGRLATATNFRVYFDSHEFAEARRKYYEFKSLSMKQSSLLKFAEEELERVNLAINEPNPWIHFARFWRALVSSIKRSVP